MAGARLLSAMPTKTVAVAAVVAVVVAVLVPVALVLSLVLILVIPSLATPIPFFNTEMNAEIDNPANGAVFYAIVEHDNRWPYIQHLSFSVFIAYWC